MAKSSITTVGSGSTTSATDFPSVPYLPSDPKNYRAKIGLIGCGGITTWHLKAYQAAGYDVLALCDIDLKHAKTRRDEFYPKAVVYDDPDDLLSNEEIDVVDIATHTRIRPPLIESALRAGKHVLSQKPFVEDLETGQRLANLASDSGRYLAVNQNGRWAPHWSFLRNAVAQGLLGDLAGVHFAVHWDHGWVKGTAFEKMRHLILYDFAIHWFDMLTCLMGDRKPTSVYASFVRSSVQEIEPPLLAQAMVQYEGAQASLVFDADTRSKDWESTYVTGELGTLRCEGPNWKDQKVVLNTEQGELTPQLEGSWFPDGFHGTMGELLCAIEEYRLPIHHAENNLASLALCFAAVESAERGEPVVPGSVTALPDGAI